MDTEWKIKWMETELRQQKELRQLQAERLDIHDETFDHVITAFDKVRENLEEIVQVQKQFAIDQAKTESMLQDLIAALTKSGGNGKH